MKETKEQIESENKLLKALEENKKWVTLSKDMLTLLQNLQAEYEVWEIPKGHVLILKIPVDNRIIDEVKEILKKNEHK